MLAFAALPTSASAWLIALLDASAKSVLIFAIAAILALALRRASAAVRHLVWALAIVSALCLPALSILLPAWPMLQVPAVFGAPASPPSEPLPEEKLDTSQPPLPATTAASTDAAQPPSATRPPAEPAASALQPPRPSPPVPAQPAAARPSRSIPSILLLIWSLGAAVALLPLLVGMHAVRRLTCRARPFTDPAWTQLLRAAAAQFALQRPLTLLRSSPNTVPMMSGLLRPVLLLPAGADAWPPDRRRLVLLHELAHVKRGDYLSQILAHLAAAVYWFNPLAWLAVCSLRRERERACDDLVLNTGFRASDYAQHLLEITRGARGAAFCSIAAVPMARPTSLEGRVHAILDARRNRRGVTRPSALLAVLAVAAIAIPLARLHAFPAPTRLGEGPDGRPLYQWNPSESWPGGSLLDPRLDQPVHFWRAGLALSELFASIEEQTGVRLGFWPEGDENPRVRLNLYLNPDQPPTLRDLMAQLAWVTDCAFAYAEATPSGIGPTYYLLGTSLGRAALPKQQAGLAAAQDRARDDHMSAEAAVGQMLLARADELRQALQLTRDQLIARYKGVDDLLLLTLLDPHRRAAAEYACGALEGAAEVAADDRPWDQLPENEQALLREAFQVDEAWVESAQPLVQVSYTWSGRPDEKEGTLWLQVFPRPEPGDRRPLGADSGSVRLAETVPLPYMREEEVLSLAGYLGEEIPPGQESAYVERWRESRRRAHEQRERQSLEQALAAEQRLSPDKQTFLSGLTLSLKRGRSYALWEVQEAIASASGLNIISDCFWQAPRPLDGAGSALSALEMSCRPEPDRTRGRVDRRMWSLAWEWRDAGSFLRFRSTDRARWRASLLPPGVLAQVDEWLEPRVRQAAASHRPDATFEVDFPGDLLQLIRIAPALDDLQLEYGGCLVYEDPADETEAWKQAVREAFMGLAMSNVDYFRFCSALSDEQSQLARQHELRCADLSEDQLSRLQSALRRQQSIVAREKLKGFVLETDGAFPAPARESVRNPSQWSLFLIYVNTLELPPRPAGRRYANGTEWRIPTHLSVRVEPRRPTEDSDGALQSEPPTDRAP